VDLRDVPRHLRNAGDAEASFTYDELLDNITLYWVTNTGASSARLYWELARSGGPRPGVPDDPISLPPGSTMFPHEHVRESRRWIERRYSNLVHFDWADRGGHFGALEAPDIMIDEIRATFRGLV
jgi:epoxide hydrolase